jgi:hypothetical protein
MKTEDFNKIVEEQLEIIRSVLVKKQAEYNLDEDRLSHFKRAAVLSQETPEAVLYGYMLKHIMSISDMIASGRKYSKEVWQEKMTDIHNYLILLLGLLEDENDLDEQKAYSDEKGPKTSLKQLLLEDK